MVGKKGVNWSRLVASRTRAQASLLVPDLQNYPGGLCGLCCPRHWYWLPPLLLCSPAAGMRGVSYHEQLQQQHQQKQQALDPRLPALCCAWAASGVSWVADICRLRICIRSDPMGCRTAREEGSKKHLTLFFFPRFSCFKSFTKKC